MVGWGDATNEVALHALLAQHADAFVVGIGADGLFVPLPDSVPVDGHPTLVARSALDLVVKEDWRPVIDAWDRTKVEGAAHLIVHLRSDPARGAALHFLDTRERYGLLLGVLVPHVDEDGHRTDVATPTPVTPRVGRMRKDEVSVVVAVDDAVSLMFGLSTDELVGARSLHLIHPEDHERAIESWMEMLAAPHEGHRVRLRHACGDGTWKWVEITNINLLDDEDHGYVVAEVLDISEEMAAQDALHRSEQLLRRLTEALPTGVVQLGADGAVQYANERAHEILGVDAPAANEQFARIVGEDAGRFAAALAAAQERGIDQDLEVEASAHGLRRRCSVNLRPLTDEADAVTGVLICLNDVTESSRLRAELEHQATYDPLTGCHNRRSTIHALNEAMDDCDDLAVVFLDLDSFKSINDELGHAAGDDLLVAVARRLRAGVRDRDIVGRIGGDEFLVVCPDVGGDRAARDLATRLSVAIETPVELAGATVAVPSASVGVAWTTAGATTADALVARADVEMYEVKRTRTGV